MKAKRQYNGEFPFTKRSRVTSITFNDFNYENNFNITPNNSDNNLKHHFSEPSNLWYEPFTRDQYMNPTYLEVSSSTTDDSMINSLEDAFTNYVFKVETNSFNADTDFSLNIDPSRIPFDMVSTNVENYETIGLEDTFTGFNEPLSYQTPDSIELGKEYDTEDEMFITPGTHFKVTFNKYGDSKTTYLTRRHFNISESAYNSPQKNSEMVMKTVHHEFDTIRKAGRKLFVPYKNVMRKEINKDSERITKARHRWMPTSINCIFHQVNSKDLRIPRDCCFGLLNCRPQAQAWKRKLKFC